MNFREMEILILATGGTLDKEYGNGIGVTDLHIGNPVIEEILQKRAPHQKSVILSLLKKDSTAITKEDRENIVGAVLESKSYPVLITHGTDTIIETGKAIKRALLDTREKIIVLTGASQPYSMRDSDVEFNIGYALAVLKSYAEQEKRGVYISIHGDTFDVDNVVKGSDGIFRPIK